MSTQEPIRVGIIGAGIFAREAHLPAWQALGNSARIAMIASRTDESAARLARMVDYPVETTTDMDAVLSRHDIDAVDIILPDVCRAGGISEGLKIARLADAHHIPWAAHVSMGTPVHIAAALHLAAATPNFLICECPTHQNPTGNNLLRAPIICQDGYFTLPQGPGLGIEINEEELAKVILEA